MQSPCWTDFLQCSICTTKYNCTTAVPVSLSCYHTICKRCISRIQTKQCPYDKTPISSNLDKYPPNTAFLILLGFTPDNWAHEMLNLSPMLVADDQLEGYTACRESVEKIAVFLKPFIDQGVLQATASVPRPVLKKIIALLSYQILEEDGRIRIIKAAHSIAERIITELLVMHQNQQQISSLIWSAVRARGCQFLGPVMQEEALKLILKLLENERAMSRKTIVMYVVQQMLPDFQNASKTNIGHIVQLLYRASCFKVSKREKDSSLMQLKPEYCTYIALRREHDAQIIKIAMEAGLRISPETWSTQLYGNTSKKSEMQSIIDKLVSQGVGSSGLSELIVAIGRSQDPYNLNERLISHLDNLLKLNITSERTTEEDDIITYENCSWETCSEGLDELFISLQVFIEFTQIQSGRYKTGMCPYLAKPTGCPRGTCCPYAHSEDERKKFVSLAKNNNNSSVTSNVTNKRIKSYQDLSQSISHVGTHRGDGGVTLGRYPSSNSIQHGGSPFSSLEEPFSSYSSGSNNVYPHDANPSFIIPTPPGATPIGLPGYYQQTNGTFPSPHYGPNPHQLTSELAFNGSYISPTVPPVGARRDVGGSDFMYRAATGPRTVKQRLPSIEATTSNASSSLQYDDVSSYPSTNSDLAITLNSISSDDSSLTGSHLFEDKVKNVSIATTLSADALKYGDNSANTVAPCTSSNNTLMQSSSDDSFSGSEQDKLHYSVASSTSDKDSNVMIPRNDSNSPTIHELEAGIQALQMQLNKKREGNHSGELIYHHPLPVIYNTSPHNTGLIHPYSSPHHGGTLHQAPSIMPIHQPLPPHSFYNPMQSGIPAWNLPHPGPLHSTPPNSGLIMQAISGPPPHMGNPHHMMPHPPQPPPNIPPHHHKEPSFQIQSDNFLAHYIQFQEQSRAPIGVNYPIAPGAHLSSHAHPPPSHPHLPRPPYQHALYGIQQNVVARQY